MKKLYVFIFLCFACMAAVAQTTTRVLYAAGPGRTGSTTNAVTTPGTMTVLGGGPFASRAYAVFDLSTIPTDAVITNVVIGFNVEAYTPGFGMTYNTYGYVGDISTLTPAATMFSDMAAPTSTLLTTESYYFGVGTKTLASTPATIGFIQGNLGGTISINFTTNTTRIYEFTDETGTLDTGGAHAPYIMIRYTCPGVTGVSATASPTAVCLGSASTLTGNSTGAVSYTWTGPGGTLATASTASASPTVETTYTFAATSGSGTGCATEALVTVSINPVPSATTGSSGPTAFCVGGTVDLFATAAGETYQWYEAGSPISGATNMNYIASTTGNYAVRVTNSLGCSVTSSIIPVLVLDTPGITPSGTINICTSGGGTALLTVNTGGITSGLAYQWQKDGMSITGATNSTYTAAVSGLYKAIVSTTAGSCTSPTEEVTVNIVPYPSPGVSFNGTLVSTASGFAAYQWYLNSVAIPGATSNTYAPTANGSYRVRVTTTTGCTNYSNPLTVGTLGIATVSGADVRVYPNPANSVVHIAGAGQVRAVVTTIAGKAVMEQSGVEELNITALPAGIYFISVYNDAGERITVQKLVKE